MNLHNINVTNCSVSFVNKVFSNIFAKQVTCRNWPLAYPTRKQKGRGLWQIISTEIATDYGNNEFVVIGASVSTSELEQ